MGPMDTKPAHQRDSSNMRFHHSDPFVSSEGGQVDVVVAVAVAVVVVVAVVIVVVVVVTHFTEPCVKS